jgi:hypothetical protein
MLLTTFRHIWNAEQSAHEGRPWLFRERLHSDKFPELPLGHDNFGYALLQNPIVKCRETNLLTIGEQRVGNGFSHSRIPWLQVQKAVSEPDGPRYHFEASDWL